MDRTPEYEKFIEELKAFHKERGTTLEPEPKMGTLTVDLLKLFNYIVEHGGYDKVSDEKLMWRKMCEGLGLMRHNAPADAYTLKQIFYKNLAAYEIKTIHKKEPPPPEILEFTTAKGGSLLTRTVENFQVKSIKGEKDESGDDGTPAREQRSNDTPSSARASRGLREAPAPRVIFHPDTNSSRQTRHASGQQSAQSSTSTPSQNHQNQQQPSQSNSQGGAPMPQHPSPHPHPNRGGASHYYNPAQDFANAEVQSFQIQPPQQMQLRIVDTPTSNPDLFAKKRRLLRQPAPNNGASASAILRAALPSNVLDGPNIYERCLLALRSGIRSEQAYGLYHLVKISYERGDKYKFSQFSGLAEGLTEFALGVGSLFYHVDWTITNDPDADDLAAGELDGINGTPDILERISQLKPKDVQDNFQSSEFTDHLTLITEAVLTIRNMAMLTENAWFLAEYVTIRDLLCIILRLPDLDVVVELKHFALDIAEQITPYLVLGADDPLYQTLLAQLNSTDRGTILTSLRAIGRIAMSHATETNKLSGVPASVLQNLIDWLLLNDDELVDACLDFLYQYTAVVANLDNLLEGTNVEHLVAHLVRLLSHGAERGSSDIIVSEALVVYDPPSDQVVPIPGDLLERLLAMEEPDRCYQWLKCFFEEDSESQITQIAIWQAYNAAFLEPLKRKGRSMINAAEFIRNISTVYSTAGAQIVRDHGPMGEVQSKFIIRGIRPRQVPISPEGRSYFRCQWSAELRHGEQPPPGPVPRCGGFFLNAETMWEHILVDHLRETRTPPPAPPAVATPGGAAEHGKPDSANNDAKFRNREGEFTCRWNGCVKYLQPTKLHLVQFMMHIKTHLKAEEAKHRSVANIVNPGHPLMPHGNLDPSVVPPKRPAPRVIRPEKTITLTYEKTEYTRNPQAPNAPLQAAGIPLSAVLILRNIARNVVKTQAEDALVKRQRLERGDVGDEDTSDDGYSGRKGGSTTTVSGLGWNERLFRPVLSRLWEVFIENNVLAPYITSLVQLIETS